MNTEEAVRTLLTMIEDANNTESMALHQGVNALLRVQALSKIKYCPFCGKKFLVTEEEG